MTPTAYEPMTAAQLYRHLEQFIQDNARHHAVENRFIADALIPTKEMVHSLGINGITTFRSYFETEIAKFRLLESEAERSKLSKAD
jgi:hypothetical protein